MVHKVSIPIFLVFTLAIAGHVQGALNWDIYSDGMIEEGDIYNIVSIYDTPPNHTTAIMVGGRVDVMRVYDASTLDMSGGDISTLLARELSTVNISGGSQITYVGCADWSTTNISGGCFKIVESLESSTLNVSGGYFYSVSASTAINISGDPNIEHMYVGCLANVNGGRIGTCALSSISILNLCGGTISNGIWAPGRDQFQFTYAVNVYGYDLAKTEIGGKYGFGQVYGTFFDGSQFLIDLGEGIYPHVNLVPETTTVILLGLGGLFVKIRRK